MAVKVAINGFGRIGRLAFRYMFGNPEFDIVAINDLTDSTQLAHLLKYDSAQGRYDKPVEATEDGIIVDGKDIKIYSERDPKNLPWAKHDVDVVMECTGFFNDEVKAHAHIDAGAKRVICSAPATGNVKMIVFGVNHETIDGTEKVLSGASCTTNCLAPMAKVMNDSFNIESGLMTTIHAYTGDQNTLDAPHANGDLRRARAAAANIVPNTTGAAKAIGKVIPALDGKLDGAAQRVPTITGSLTELFSVVPGTVTADEVNAAMKAAANPSFGYNEDMIVSTDIIGATEGSIFDATQTKVMPAGANSLVKTVAWYDNEASYTHQLVRTAQYFVENMK